MAEAMRQSPNSSARHDQSRDDRSPLVTVVIPTFNEVANIGPLIDEVIKILDGCQVGIEIVVVDDGSTDSTFDEVTRLYHADSRVRALRFSRNFGKEAALLAGLRAAEGDAIITMDADFQHPPSVIPDLLRSWRQGARVVHGVKRSRDNDPWLVRTRAAIFNGLMARLAGVNVRHSSDFKLLDRVAAGAIVHDLPEHSRFYRGLTSWIGYRATTVPFDVGTREHGDATMSLRRLFALATVALVSFTAAPLRIVSLLGMLTLCFGLVIGLDALVSWWQEVAVSGFATLIFTILIVGSFIMISLGIIGEYLAKIYDEVKARPPYLVESMKGFSDAANAAPADRDTCRDRPTRSRKSVP